MKNLFTYLTLIVGCLISKTLTAQVSHSPQKKNFLIEKGTGQVCGSCPGIALKCDTVIHSHPGKGMLIEYHFGPDATPQAGALSQDFRTPYGDTIYDPNGLHWPFYLNMMVNRRDQGLPWGSTFIFGPNNNQVQPEADKLVLEASPLNLYMAPSYNSATRELSVNVELFYTENAATDTNYLQIAITEDSIISMQYDPVYYTMNNGFNPKFNHTNVFRANLNGFTGDIITKTTKGTLISRTYKYTFPLAYKNINCTPQNCKLTLYVADKKNRIGTQKFTGKVITAIRTDIQGKLLTSVSKLEPNYSITIKPNPSSGTLVVEGEDLNAFALDVINLQGQSVFTRRELNSNKAIIDLTSQPRGLYFVRVQTEKGLSVHKVILAD